MEFLLSPNYLSRQGNFQRQKMQVKGRYLSSWTLWALTVFADNPRYADTSVLIGEFMSHSPKSERVIKAIVSMLLDRPIVLLGCFLERS